MSGRPIKDYTGNVYANLTVIEQDGWHVNKTLGIRQTKWRCQCACGNQTTVVGGNLTSGRTTSCGCAHKGVNRKPDTPLRGKFNMYKQRAKAKGIAFSLDLTLFSHLISQNCSMCDLEPKDNLVYYKNTKNQTEKRGSEFNEQYSLSQIPKFNTIDRINPNLGYHENNCQTLCLKCNIKKGSLEKSGNPNRHLSDTLFRNKETS